ncbi:MAG: hypothetical protein WC654_07995 [Patescibacteria group bacterium]
MQHYPRVGDRLHLPDNGTELLIVVDSTPEGNGTYGTLRCIRSEDLKVVNPMIVSVFIGPNDYDITQIRFAYHKPITRHTVYTD